MIVGRLIPAGTGKMTSIYQKIASNRDLKQIADRNLKQLEASEELSQE